MKFVWLSIVLVGLSGCATARHLATVADATFAQAVFAVDDAEYKACQTHAAPFTVEVCAKADPLVKQALVDVKAVTAAIKASPKNAPVPTSLPSLLADLTAIRDVIAPLSSTVVKENLVTKVEDALTQTIRVLSVFAGGK